MAEELQPEVWPKLFRRYLALRRGKDLETAVACAPREVAEFLAVCRRGDTWGASERIVALRERFHEEDEERLTLELGYCDVLTNLCGASVEAAVLKRGIKACQSAIVLASDLKDLPCASHYQLVAASGFQALGDAGSAAESFVAAMEAYNVLAGRDPDTYGQSLIGAVNNFGAFLQISGALRESRAAYEEAREIGRRLAGAGIAVRPDILAMTLSNLGHVLIDLELPAEARETCLEALAICRGLGDDYRERVAQILDDLGRACRGLAEPDEALRAVSERLAIFRHLDALRPGAYLSRIAESLNDLSFVMGEIGNVDQAIAALSEAVVIWRRLADSQPAAYGESLMGAVNNFGNLLRVSGVLHEARAAFKEVREIGRQLAAAGTVVRSDILATALGNLGHVLIDLELPAEAREACLEAIAIYRGLGDECQEKVAQLLDDLIRVCRILNEPEGALGAVSEQILILRRLDALWPGTYLPDVAGSLNNLSVVMGEMGDVGQEIAASSEAVAIWRRLVEQQPTAYLFNLAIALHNLAGALHAGHDLVGASRVIEEALAIRRQLASDQSGVHQTDLAGTLLTLANVLKDQPHRLGQARDACLKAVSMFRVSAEALGEADLVGLASALNSLGVILLDLNELEEARKTLFEALRIREQLAEIRPSTYAPAVAKTLGNLGNVFVQLGDLGEAEDAIGGAVGLYRTAAQQRPGVHLPELARVLDCQCVLMRILGELGTARDAGSEAVAVYRSLAEHQRGIYLPRLAKALHNLGIVFLALDDFEGAGHAFQEALSARQHLADEWPDVYLYQVAETLNGLGGLYFTQANLPLASEAFLKSARLYESCGIPIQASVPAANLAQVERHKGDRTLAVSWAEKALEYLEIGLAQLSTAEHYDKFKGQIDQATEMLIDLYEAGQDDASASRLLRLLESLRRAEATVGLHRPAQSRTPQLPSAFPFPIMWIQRAEQVVTFVLKSPGRPFRIVRSPKIPHDAWLGRKATLESALAGGDPAMIADAAGLLFEIFPEEIRALLSERREEPVFVSPCPKTVDLPLEVIPARNAAGQSTFAGLNRLVVRFHSVADLSDIAERTIRAVPESVAVVGNPTCDCPDTAKAARYAAGLIGAAARTGQEATLEWAQAAFANPELGILLFCGHGWFGALIMAGGAVYSVTDQAAVRWRGRPFVHSVSCWTGLVAGTGGGRFVGMPSAMLMSGAGAVLASHQPMYQEPAMRFSNSLYEAMILQRLPLGRALIQARQMSQDDPGNLGSPTFWATSVLWGNPSIRLETVQQTNFAGAV